MNRDKDLNDKIFDIQSFKKGDEETFRKIFLNYYNPVVGFCQQFINDRDKARSISQEAFIQLWESREKVISVNGIRSFLYTIARSRCLNHLRHEEIIRRHQKKDLAAGENRLKQEVLASFDFDLLEFSELDSRIKGLIEGLPPKCRQVFICSRIENKSNREIASELGIALKSVESNITRALKRIREGLGDYL